MTIEKLMKVLTILDKLRPGGTVKADVCFLWFGNFLGLTEEEKAELKRLGCYYDDEYESWGIHT